MGSSNASSASSCDDIARKTNVILPWPSSIVTNDSPYIRLSSFGANGTCVLCLGIAAALFAILWLVRRYGPYVFTEAKSPAHRTGENDRLLTHIHDKWYDLSAFEHPGGPIALSLVHQRDGTALFESHHPFAERAALMRVLSKFAVPEGREGERGCGLMDPRDDGRHYAWEGMDDDGFASDLRGLVRDHFSAAARRRGVSPSQAAKATPARWALILSLMAGFFGTLPRYARGDWAFLILTPLLAWVTAVNYWHDGLHFSLSTDWRINAWLPYLFPYYSSPWMWYHEHVIGHHAYPNVDHKDPDLAHAPQLMREHRSIKWKPTHVGQEQWHRVLIVWGVALGMGLSLLNDAKANLKLSYNNVVPYSSLSRPRITAHVLGRMGYVVLLHVWPYFQFPLWKAIIWSVLPGFMLSFYFMLNTQINHLSESCAHASSPNFYKHQVITAQNFGNGNLFCYYFSGGLNYQIEHHLFPTINHCHLPALRPGIKRICAKHGVPYNHVSGYGEAMAEHFAHSASMASQPQ